MYVRGGRRLGEVEEGSAFFDPTLDVDQVRAPEYKPRVLGLNPELLTRGFTGMGAPGDDEGDVMPPPEYVPVVPWSPHGPSPFVRVWQFAGVIGAAAGAYHGYRRTQSVGWAFVWGFFGSVFPIITVPIAVAQGFGQRK